MVGSVKNMLSFIMEWVNGVNGVNGVGGMNGEEGGGMGGGGKNILYFFEVRTHRFATTTFILMEVAIAEGIFIT